jgi:hypothetical protein
MVRTLIVAGAAATLLGGAPGAVDPGGPAGQPPADRPLVRVTTPDSPAYVLGSGYRAKILVGIEITDAGGAGIVATDSGEPRFVSPSRNVEIFLRNVISKGTYTNYRGQTVMQLVAAVPAEKLELSEMRISVPIDPSAVDFATLPKGAMLFTDAADVAEFNFEVKDRKGMTSDAEAPENTLKLGFAPALSRPAPPYLTPVIEFGQPDGDAQAPPSP